MSIIFETFGYFVNLKLLGFIYKDEENEWYALTDFKGKLLEHKLRFQVNRQAKNKASKVIILITDTPHGTLSYLDFDTKTNMTHAHFLPDELRADMANSFGIY